MSEIPSYRTMCSDILHHLTLTQARSFVEVCLLPLVTLFPVAAARFPQVPPVCRVRGKRLAEARASEVFSDSSRNRLF